MMEAFNQDGEAMSEFAAVLRAQVDQAWQALNQARQVDNNQVHQHGARMLERAASHGADITDWVSADLVSVAMAAAGSES